MSKTSCCAQAMTTAETDAAHLFVADMARDGAAAWRDFLHMVDSALLPIAWIVAALRSQDARARRMAGWARLSDRDLRDVGLARGGFELLAEDSEDVREIHLAPRFE